MSVDVSPRSHIDTPAWQSFESRMRARAAEHRAAKRKRRVRWAVVSLCAAAALAGAAVGVQMGRAPVTAFTANWPDITLTWPDLPAAPALSLPAVAAPLPLPSNWDAIGERIPVENEPLDLPLSPESVVVSRPAESPPPSRPPAPTGVASRSIEWPPRTTAPEAPPPPPLEPVRLADPPPAAVSLLPPPPAAPVAPVTPRVDPRDSVRGAIERYRSAYERLDVSAARAIWPGVDAGALTRAFGALRSQQLSFDDCAITVAGTSADANCSGRARVVPKIGGGSESARRTWQFRLRQSGNEWVIERATVR